MYLSQNLGMGIPTLVRQRQILGTLNDSLWWSDFYECLCIGACRAVWVPAWAKLGCTAFDAQLWKAYFVTTLYDICTCACISMHMLYRGSSCQVLVIWVCMILNNPGNAQVCPGLQAPMCLWVCMGWDTAEPWTLCFGLQKVKTVFLYQACRSARRQICRSADIMLKCRFAKHRWPQICLSPDVGKWHYTA